MITEVKNESANNESGVRANILYGNMLDQMRYLEALEYTNGCDVLDIACGIGWGSYVMSKSGAKTVIGIDMSEDALRSAKKYYSNGNIKYILGNSANIPMGTNSVDVIVSFETYEHIEDIDSFKDELYRVARSNALLILSTPNGYCFKRSVNGKPENPFHFKEYLREDIENTFSDEKWEIISYKGQYPMKMASEDVKKYRKFIFNYWKINRVIAKFGFIGKFLILLLKSLKLLIINEPAYKDSCMPKNVEVGHEPAYHFFVFKCLK